MKTYILSHLQKLRKHYTNRFKDQRLGSNKLSMKYKTAQIKNTMH